MQVGLPYSCKSPLTTNCRANFLFRLSRKSSYHPNLTSLQVGHLFTKHAIKTVTSHSITSCPLGQTVDCRLGLLDYKPENGRETWKQRSTSGKAGGSYRRSRRVCWAGRRVSWTCWRVCYWGHGLIGERKKCQQVWQRVRQDCLTRRCRWICWACRWVRWTGANSVNLMQANLYEPTLFLPGEVGLYACWWTFEC